MCRNSLKNKKCFVENCKFLHVRGTNRKQDTPGQKVRITPGPLATTNVDGGIKAQGSDNLQNGMGNFLDLVIGMKSAMETLTKTVETQVLLANLARENKTGYIPIPIPQQTTMPVPNHQVPWASAVLTNSR